MVMKTMYTRLILPGPHRRRHCTSKKIQFYVTHERVWDLEALVGL